MFEQHFKVKDKHIDVQGIMDGLYYPFYMEECRHKFVEEELKFNISDNASNGINMVLSQMLIRFRRPLKMNDEFIVNCSIHPDKKGRSQFYFRQDIICNSKVMTEGFFIATCVMATGGGAFIPDYVAQYLSGKHPLTDENIIFPRVLLPK
jgi:acyl-CoA thioester hydrolase